MPRYVFIAVNDGNRWGGSELLWSQAAEKLVRCGNEVRVSVKGWGEPVEQIEHLRSRGCQILYRSEFPPFLYRLGRRFFPLPEYRRLHVRRAVKGVDLVVISQGSNTDGLAWMEETHAAGRKYVVIAQGAIPYSWPDDSVSERLAESYERAEASFFVSQAILDASRRQFASPLGNAKVVRNPFSVRYEVRLTWPACAPDELRLACVARQEIGKGQDLILQVLGLPHWRKRPVKVSLIGTGPNERILRRITEQLKLASVDFPGYSKDIEEVWSRHHALVLASRHEGMPLSVVEAMLCGRPCIATDVGGNKELIRDGVNGFLAKAPTVELLDEAMNRAWECRGQLKGMGERAAADVRAWVSPDPGEDFARELTSLVNGAHKVESCA
jgi:glycosyltransferase involved in cell wall biosynthesis